MSKRIEMMVNAQVQGNVTLARVRGVDAKTFKFTNEPKLSKLGKNDGVVVEISEMVEKGNYIVPTNYKIIDVHVSGKRLDANSYFASLEATEPAPTEAPF